MLLKAVISMMNRAKSTSNRFLSEIQRFLSILSYSIDNSEESFETMLDNQDKSDIDRKTIEELAKSSKKLEKDAEIYVNHIGIKSRPRKVEKEDNSKESTFINSEAKKASKTKIVNKENEIEF